MLISEIAAIVEGRMVGAQKDVEINTIVYDSRKATGSANELFIALTGTNHDGHDYVEGLAAAGSTNFLVAREMNLSRAAANVMVVPDVLKAFQQVVRHHRKQFAVPVVGITGSNGKTIVKEWLSTLLGHELEVAKSPKSFNSQLGVPLSLWSLNDSHQVGVFEAGISKPHEMQLLEQMIRPTLGIFTNIGQAHSEGFESQHAKLVEKARLFDHSDQVVCRYNHTTIRAYLTAKPSPVVSWGLDQPEAALNFQKLGTDSYQVTHADKLYCFRITWSNPLDLENLFHCLTAAILLGESQQNIQAGIDELKPVPMRLELKRGQNNCYVLDDSYNNDLLGLQVALEYLKQQPHKSKTTVILSDILQSGKPTTELYQLVDTLMTNHGIHLLIGIGKEMAHYKRHFNVPFQCFDSVDSFLKNSPGFSDETILVKGARAYGLEKIVAYLEEQSHGTVLEVNFEAIVHNLNLYRSRLKPATKLMVMVKAFAYGIGVEEIAHLLQYHQVDYLGVAYLDEAINLRRKGINTPIMIMNVNPDHLGLLPPFQLEPEIYSVPLLKGLLEETATPPPIHLKIESGMNRLGLTKADVEDLLPILAQNPQLKVAGIFTHFSSAENPDEDTYTRQQAETFNALYQVLSGALGYAPLKHAVNSAGIVRWPQHHFDLVRLGIGLYGFDSSSQLAGLKPTSTLKSKISQIKTVQAGDSIGYSRKGRAEVVSKIATIAIGYADGYLRHYGNGNAYVLVNGRPAWTIGNVCMDMTMIDVTDLAAKEGDEVILFGEKPHIEELASWGQTIPYEVLTNVSPRVKRVFVSE